MMAGAPIARGPDWRLVRAEQQVAQLHALWRFMARQGAPQGLKDAVLDRVFGLDSFIRATWPKSPAGAAVKLRRMLDPQIGTWAGDEGEHVDELQQILVAVERAA